MSTCPKCGHRFGPKKQLVPEWQRERDRERYEAAMAAKREHEAKFGPIRPPAKRATKLKLVEARQYYSDQIDEHYDRDNSR